MYIYTSCELLCLCSIWRLQPPLPSCSGRQGCPAGTERYNHFYILNLFTKLKTTSYCRYPFIQTPVDYRLSLLQTLYFLGWCPPWNAVQNTTTCGGVLHKLCLPEFLALAWTQCLMLSCTIALRTSTTVSSIVSPFDLTVSFLSGLCCPCAHCVGYWVTWFLPASVAVSF